MKVIGPGQTFDPIAHRYYDNGKLVPFFSWVMEVEGLRDVRFSSQAALDRGTEVHRLCHFLAKGTLDWRTTDDSLLGYLEAYQRFLAETGFVPDVERCERGIINPTYGYGVTPDQPGAIPIDNGVMRNCVVDLKSVAQAGAIDKWVRLQTASQALSLWPMDYLTAVRIAVQLRPDGSFFAEYHDDPDDFDAWLAMLGSAMWKLNNNYVKLEKEIV